MNGGIACNARSLRHRGSHLKSRAAEQAPAEAENRPPKRSREKKPGFNGAAGPLYENSGSVAPSLARLDGASAEVRDAGVGALRAVHALLDDKQRRRLAELLDRRSWWRGDGMYR